jgi:MFS family permease
VLLIHVFDLTGSAFATALIPVFASLPSILIGPIAGVVVDRSSRQRMMAWCALSLAGVMLLAIPFTIDRQVWLLYALTFTTSAVMTFFSPAENALLPSLVAEPDLRTANSLNGLNDAFGRIIGPAVGAMLLVQVGFAATLAAAGATYLVAWLLLLGLQDFNHREPAQEHQASEPPDVTPTRPNRLSGPGVWTSFQDGLAVVRGSFVLGLLVLISALTFLAEVPLGAVLPAFMRESVGVGPELFGQLMSVRGLAGLLGGTIVVMLSRRLSETWLLSAGLAIGGGSFFLFGFASTVPMSIILLFPIGFASAAYQTGMLTLFQKHAPDEVRGRVFALMGTLNGMIVLTASLLAGVVAEAIGARPVMMASGILYAIPLALTGIVILQIRSSTTISTTTTSPLKGSGG